MQFLLSLMSLNAHIPSTPYEQALAFA